MELTQAIPRNQLRSMQIGLVFHHSLLRYLKTRLTFLNDKFAGRNLFNRSWHSLNRVAN